MSSMILICGAGCGRIAFEAGAGHSSARDANTDTADGFGARDAQTSSGSADAAIADTQFDVTTRLDAPSTDGFFSDAWSADALGPEASHADVPRVADLVAWYPFEDDPGDGVTDDASGNGHTGACSVEMSECPTRISGRVGSAYRFALGQYFRIPHSADFTVGTGLTITVWVRSSGPLSGTIATKPFGPAVANSWEIEIVGPNEIRFHTSDGSYTRAVHPAAGGYFHVAAVFEQDGDRRVYVNGALNASTTPHTTSFDARDIMIGTDLEGTGRLTTPFQGEMDELRVYSRALTIAEIQALASP